MPRSPGRFSDHEADILRVVVLMMMKKMTMKKKKKKMMMMQQGFNNRIMIATSLDGAAAEGVKTRN
jgi:hypothetical protein